MHQFDYRSLQPIFSTNICSKFRDFIGLNITPNESKLQRLVKSLEKKNGFGRVSKKSGKPRSCFCAKNIAIVVQSVQYPYQDV